MRTLVIEILREKEQLKMSAFYKDEGMTHRHYSVHGIEQEGVDRLSGEIFDVLSRIDGRGKVTATSFEELRKSSRLLYNQLFPDDVKAEIRSTNATHLIYYIDEKLVSIPWELLHDGNNFLSLRFATGRIVLTSRKMQADPSRTLPEKLNMLAVCNPTNDLKMAYSEGVAIRRELLPMKAISPKDRKRTPKVLELRMIGVLPSNKGDGGLQ